MKPEKNKKHLKNGLPNWAWVVLWPFIAIVPVVIVFVMIFAYQSFLSRIHIGIVIAASVLLAVVWPLAVKTFMKRRK